MHWSSFLSKYKHFIQVLFLLFLILKQLYHLESDELTLKQQWKMLYGWYNLSNGFSAQKVITHWAYYSKHMWNAMSNNWVLVFLLFLKYHDFLRQSFLSLVYVRLLCFVFQAMEKASQQGILLIEGSGPTYATVSVRLLTTISFILFDSLKLFF